jgi:hypothetical protein
LISSKFSQDTKVPHKSSIRVLHPQIFGINEDNAGVNFLSHILYLQRIPDAEGSSFFVLEAETQAEISPHFSICNNSLILSGLA